MLKASCRRSARTAGLAWTTLVAAPGCKACGSSSPGVDVGSETPLVISAGSSTERPPQVHDLDLLPIAVALRSGPRVWMWVDGRSSAVAHPTDRVAWSPRGFEFTVNNGLTKVLAPGGSFYYRVAAGDASPTQPISSLFDGDSDPPPGWSVEYVDGAGGKRVQAFLRGPEGRRVRLGLFLSQPDDAVWITGALPSEGQASPPLPETVRFRAGADGALLNDVPLGGEPLEWTPVSQDKLQQWVAAIQPFHNGGTDLTAGMHASADLDRDGELETLLCISGRIRMLDPRCVLVDEVGSETRMYAVGLPWTADGGAPVGFTVDGAPYVFMVSPMDPSIGFVLRYYSAGWIAEAVE